MLISSEQHQTSFYKTFGRPMAKVFLVAVFTYQLAYYWWVRLEQDEIKREMQGERVPRQASTRNRISANQSNQK